MANYTFHFFDFPATMAQADKDFLESAYITNFDEKSEELCENNELGQAMTFNNMACYYRRIGKMRTALNFL